LQESEIPFFKCYALFDNLSGVAANPKQDALKTVDLGVLEHTFAVNTYGPLLLTQQLLPNVLKSEKPRLAFMSSRVGSIEDNSTGGNYAYRASKTALNSICKSLAVELKGDGVIVVIMHPGIVKVLSHSILFYTCGKANCGADESHSKLGRTEGLCFTGRSSEQAVQSCDEQRD